MARKPLLKKSKTAASSEKRPLSLTVRRKTGGVQRLRSGIDWPFAILVLILLVIGTIFIFSASYVYANHKFEDSFYFIKRQVIWVGAALTVFFLIIKFSDYLWLKRCSTLFFIVSYLLVWAALLFGNEINGAKRWLGYGSFTFQPSELLKFAVILVISSYVVKMESKDKDAMRSFKHGILPFGYLGVAVAIPLILQPHLSATIIMLCLIFGMMWLGGSKKSVLLTCAGIAFLAMAAIVLFTSHGQARINSWLHPESDIQNDGWQALQSLYAIGSGGLWGVGLGASKQKHLYLPEPQNDYIFAIVCEEMGFVFAVAVICLFVLLIWRGFYIGKNAPSKFSSLLVMGIVMQIGIQVFLNIGVVTGTLPSTGVSLPFFSYGGSSLMIFMAEMGVVLNISKYSYMEKS